MSKNRNYQGKRVEIKPVDEMIPEEIKEEIKEEVEEVIEEETKVILEDAVEPTYGEVVNCDKLYVRSRPTKESDPVKTINKGDKLEVIVDAVIEDWFKVRLIDEYNTGGYCMEKYIKVIN